ncbi:beta-taxilin isoform X2 [Micropterus salmoides]|uniref:beta-taxilin isoform X2 n=1 Tax=Micropterus salmoides TaxID=27706 RepID=UPI0018EBAC32|nr:beta-taxilin isoform X2 [Micropterus salmoides]
METSVKAAEVMVPQPDVADAVNAEGNAAAAAPAAACGSSSDFFDPMEEFSRRLEDIISTHGSAASLPDKQRVVEAETEKEEDDITVTMETEVSLIMQSLNKISSPEKKLEDLVKKHAELAALRRCDEKKLCDLQQRLSSVLDERQQLQAESRSSIAARSKLESLCRELQGHYNILREETIQRCREDEEKRKEMTSHFQMMLTEIQAQIEQHSARNDKLCHENSNLTDKLESLMNQCEMREESLEKINQRRDLQHKLTEAKLQQANALLNEAEEKHKREKEYLLVQAAEWKLQAQTLREQGTVMQAQLALYAQKFDEFQATLAKSNEIYVRFKKEMDNMSDKMKKMEKESNLWKTRFENCNKALTDMIEERGEKAKEYDLFVLKIQKLEKLCRALQEERAVLYDKIKEVRQANSNLPSKYFGSSTPDAIPDSEGADKTALLTTVEIQEIQEEDPVLTEGMTRLKEEQAKLQEFAASLLATPSDDDQEDNGDLDPEEDLVASAFDQFKTQTQVRKEVVSVPEQTVDVKSEAAESVLPQPAVSTPEAPTPVQNTSEADGKPEAEKVQTPVKEKEVQPVKLEDEIQHQPEAPTPVQNTSETEAKVQTQVKEVQPVKLEDEIQQEPEAPTPVQNTSATEAKVQTQVKEVQPVKLEEEIQQEPEAPTPVQNTSATEAKVQTQVKEVQPVKLEEEIQQEPAEPVPTTEPEKVQINPPTDPKPEAGEVKPVVPVGDEEVQAESAQVPEEKPKTASPTENSDADSPRSKR